MFALFKKRDFSAYFSDTISFFKLFGKNYFKNYFIVNGIFLLILVVLIYFISKIYMEAILSTVSSQNQAPNYLFAFLDNNVVLIVGLILFFVLLAVFLSLLNITYPVIYLQLIEKTSGNSFTSSEIISALKQNIGRLLLFLLGILFIILPLMLVVFALLILMCFILIGIPLIMIAGPAFMSWIALSYYEYIIKKVGFFQALINGFRLVKQQFWTTIGTTFIMLILVQVLQGFITMIPYVIGMILMFTSSQGFQEAGSQNEAFSTMPIVMAVIMVFSVLLSYFFNNILIINQGLIYYSLREQNENNVSKSQIDLIGTDSE